MKNSFKFDNKMLNILGVDQAKALSKLLDSEESSSEDENKKSDEDGEDEDETGKKKKKKKGDDTTEEENGSKDMPDGAEDEKAKKAEKRKALVDNVLDINAAGPSAKKGRMDPFPQGAGKYIKRAGCLRKYNIFVRYFREALSICTQPCF